MASTCEYELVDAPNSFLDEPKFIFWNDPDPSASGSLPSQRPCIVSESLIKTRFAPISPRQPALGPAPSALVLAHPLGQSSPPACGSPEPPPHAINETERHGLPLAISIISPGIPPWLRVTSSPTDPERLQLSDAALGELDMKLYVFRAC